MNNESETYKSANVVLTNDIVVNENVLKDDGTLNDGDFKAWTPIETDFWYDDYTGTFDGAGHTISGLYFNSENQTGGFFKALKGTITNLGIIDSYFCGGNGTSIICRYNQGTISNVYTSGVIFTNSGGIGGVVSKTMEGLKTVILQQSLLFQKI